MTSVIYLKRYSNGLIYVGRYRGNDWDKYSKASGGGVARQYRWKPIETVVLKDTSNLSFKEHCNQEAFFINDMARIYGIHPLATKLAHNLSFVSKYKVGILLNTHDMDGSQCLSEEVRKKARKSVLTRDPDFYKNLGRCMTKEEMSKRAAKSNKTRIDRGDSFFTVESRNRSHSEEANAKRKASYRNTAIKYAVNGEFIGTTGEIAERFNMSHSYVSIYCRKALKERKPVGPSRGPYKDMVFSVVE